MQNNNPYAPPASQVTEPPLLPHTELAGRGTRFVSALLDALLMIVIIVPLQFFSGAFGRSTQAAQEADGFLERITANVVEGLAWGAFGMILWVLLNFVFLANGQTIGKKIMSIKVVRKNGDALERKRYVLMRYFPTTALSMIPLVGGLVSLVDALLIFRADHNTLHDDIADTKVIKV